MTDHFARVLKPRYQYQETLHVTPTTLGSHHNDGYAISLDNWTQKRVIGLTCRQVVDITRPGQQTPLDKLIQTLTHLRHPGLAEYLEHYVTRGEEFHITYHAFDDFTSLQSFMEYSGSITEYRIIGFIGSQIASALLYLHTNGYCVESLNPYKVLLNQQYAVKLIDYVPLPDGMIPIALHQQTDYQQNDVGFNPDVWKAPELRVSIANTIDSQQKEKKKQYNAFDVLNHAIGAADVYSVGCILYFMMKRIYPMEKTFEGDVMGMSVYASSKTQFLLNLIRRCCSLQPRERISIASLLEQLKQLSVFQDDSMTIQMHDRLNKEGPRMGYLPPVGQQPSSHFPKTRDADKPQNTQGRLNTREQARSLDYSNQDTRQSNAGGPKTDHQLDMLEAPNEANK